MGSTGEHAQENIGKNTRATKIEEALVKIAAYFIGRESNRGALITITRAEVFERGRKAIIFATVLPTSAEESAINFLKRKRAEIRTVVKQQLPIHPLPFLDFEIDKGEKARQTIDALLKE